MNREGLLTPLVKSLLFTALTVLATAVLAVSIAQTDVGDTVAYKARFSDASGLREGDSVRIAGVRIGRVEEVGLTGRRTALVRFSVERRHVLPATATATIKYVDLVGQRYVELDRGTGAPGELRPGATIPLERTRPALDMTQLFNGFKPLMQALSPGDVNKLAGSIIQVFQGEGATMESLLATVGSLTGAIAGKDRVIGQVIGNLNAVLDTLNARGGRLVDLVTTLSRLISGLSADRGPIGAAVSALDDLTHTTAGLLQAGRAPLKKDIAQLGRLSGNLADESATVEKFLNMLPIKTQAIGRLGSYGSWLNFFLCEARLTGATYKQYPDAQLPPPTGIGVTAARCRS